MQCKEPESMDELIYFTNRFLEGTKGYAKAWARKLPCPKCKKGKMGKPINPKTGRPKPRAAYYECDACGYQESKEEHAPKLIVEIKYKCPECSHESCVQMPYKRKKYKGVDAFITKCENCGYVIAVTKKMKAIKKKK